MQDFDLVIDALISFAHPGIYINPVRHYNLDVGLLRAEERADFNDLNIALEPIP